MERNVPFAADVSGAKFTSLILPRMSLAAELSQFLQRIIESSELAGSPNPGFNSAQPKRAGRSPGKSMRKRLALLKFARKGSSSLGLEARLPPLTTRCSWLREKQRFGGGFKTLPPTRKTPGVVLADKTSSY